MANYYRSCLDSSGIEIDSITVTTPPTTTSYMQGDTFDPTGIVVIASASGMTKDVTADCIFTPSILATAGTQTITIGYGGKVTTTSVTVSEVSISITTPPTKTEYEKGDILDLTGIVVTAMDGQKTKNVTSQCTFSPANGDTLTTAGDITITATYYGHTALTTISVAGLVSISITTPPTKTIYRENDTLDLTGIVVTADYRVSTRDVTSQCTFSPANGATLTSSSTTLTVTFLDQSTTMPITIIASSLDATDWTTIKTIGAAGTGSQYWSIGDTKSVYLNGTVGALSVNTTLRVFIIHFNYRSQNGVYFQGFKTAGGTSVALVDANYNKTSRDGSKYFNLYHWNVSSNNFNWGGWKGSDMRYDILGSTDVAPDGYGSPASAGRVGYDATSSCTTNPVSNTLMSALPSELRAVLAPWTIYSDNVGGTISDYSASGRVSASIDYLPLLAVYEVYGDVGTSEGYTSTGSKTSANRNEFSYQDRMSYYANGGSRTFYKHNATSTITNIWMRSVVNSKGSDYRFCRQLDDRNNYVGIEYCTKSYGINPAFRVA